MNTKSLLLGLGALALLAGACKSADDSTLDLSGRIMAGPVDGATVSVSDENGSVLATGSTDANGDYSLSIPDSVTGQTLLFSAEGGSYTDESTGNSVNLNSPLKAYVAANGLDKDNTSVSLTPSSTIIAQATANWSTHNSSTTALADRLSAATTAFEDQFGYSVDTSVMPVDASSTPDASATDDQKMAGLRAAAFSQLTQDVGSPANSQMALVTSLGTDLADGSLDGKAGTRTIYIGGAAASSDLGNQFENAYRNFFQGDRNQSGLVSSDLDSPAFHKVAKTNSYMVTYVAGSMGAKQGKTSFSLKVADHSGNAITGASISLMPMMYMDAYSHSSPVPSSACSESSTAGTYSCKLYYLMPSVMNGNKMGYWKLTAKITKSGASESAVFYPSVGASMGSTARATLRHPSNNTMSMSGGTEARYFFLFKESLSGSTGSHSFSIYLATRESMMSFPAVVSGTTYNSGTAYALTTTTITVEASTDASNWSTMTSSGSGVWSITGLSGLTDGTSGKIYVRVTIDNTQLSTDGNAASGSTGYATFSVTP